MLTLVRKICRINGRKLPEDFDPACFMEEVTNYYSQSYKTSESKFQKLFKEIYVAEMASLQL